MKVLILGIVLLVSVITVRGFMRSRKNGIHTKTIQLSEIGDVYHQISTQGVEASFVVFIITPPGRDADDTVEVQLSVEKSVTGLDWILMSEANKQEKTRVIQYALSKDFEWQECEMNNWIYLRIDQGDLVELCTSLIKDLFETEHVRLKYAGFKYR